MIDFAQTFYEGVQLETFYESCGIADLITTCYAGRNRRAGEEFVKGKVGKNWRSNTFHLLYTVFSLPYLTFFHPSFLAIIVFFQFAKALHLSMFGGWIHFSHLMKWNNRSSEVRSFRVLTRHMKCTRYWRKTTCWTSEYPLHVWYMITPFFSTIAISKGGLRKACSKKYILW